MHRESRVHAARPWNRVLPADAAGAGRGMRGLGSLGADGPTPESPAAAHSARPPRCARAPGSDALVPPPRGAAGRHRHGARGGRHGGHFRVVWLSSPRMDEDREPVPGERRALTLARYAPDGRVRWTREFSGMRVASPRVAASPSGSVFLTGNAFLYPLDFGLGAANDGFLVKFSGDGQPLWQRRVGQKVYGLAADGEGGVLVAAEEWTPEGHLPVLAHHDAEGVHRWTRQLDAVAEGTRAARGGVHALRPGAARRPPRRHAHGGRPHLRDRERTGTAAARLRVGWAPRVGQGGARSGWPRHRAEAGPGRRRGAGG